MRFRWKLLILLLTITLVPMAYMRYNANKVIHRVTEELTGSARMHLMEMTERELRLFAEDAARLMSMRRRVLEVSLYSQARAVERCLAGQGEDSAGAVFLDEFWGEGALEEELSRSSLHMRVRPSGSELPLLVYRRGQVFKLPPGQKDKNAFASQVARLKPMDHEYPGILDVTDGKFVLWQMTALESGLLSVYPGTGNLPWGYDPRLTSWYRQALKQGQVWTYPFVDPITRKMVVAVARKLTDSSGKALGVTAICVPLEAVLRDSSETALIPGTEVFLVIDDHLPGGDCKLRVLAGRELVETRQRNWRMPVRPEYLEADLCSVLETGEGGAFRAGHKGRDSLWVLSPTDHDSAFLAVVAVEDILAPGKTAEDYISRIMSDQFMAVRLLLFVVSGVVVALAVLFSSYVTRSLDKLAEGARRLGRGDFSVRVDIRSRDEFGAMGDMFNRVVPRLEENLRIHESLNLAKELQQSLLPKSPPRVPGLDIAGVSIYSEATGGDYIDYMCPADCTSCGVGIFVGDVSGHGIAAALLMTTARALIRARLAQGGTPASVIADVNRELTRDVYETGRFMTLFFLAIDATRTTARWVRAGHEPALIYDSGEDRFTELKGDGLALGVDEGYVYEENSFGLRPGMLIFIGTDGIWEARDYAGEMFGRERLRQVIRDNSERTAEEIVQAVVSAVTGFCGARRVEDDLTLSVVRVL